MKKITLLVAFLFAAFSINAQIFEDSFETYDDFDFENIGDWTLIDIDGFGTFGSNAVTFDNAQYTGSAIVFNHTTATIDADGMPASSDPNFQVRTGEKGLWFFAATTAPNDDYAITPQISLAGFTDATFSFWAKSITDNFGLEQFEVLLSTTGTDVADFTEDLSGGIITAPTPGDGDVGNEYAEFSYDLSAYDGQDIYLAIHYVGDDSFILQMDDFLVDGTLSTDEFNTTNFSQFYNVNNNELRLSASIPMQSVKVFNTLGQEVVNKNLSNTEEAVNLSTLSNGIYIAQVAIGNTIETFKIIKR